MIQVSQPSITELEKKYVNQALDEGYISTGRFIPAFEEKWAEINKMWYGVAVNSGTTAMYVALLALGIGKGDEVIVPEFTMASTAWAVSYTGATPVFVDCSDDLNIDRARISKAITRKTKAIMVVHVYGRNARTDYIQTLAVKHQLWVVEDMAEAHGIIPKGDIACYSFQGNKIISTGEGGMCLTKGEDLANEMRKLSTLYFDKERTMIHEKIGHNFKMTNVAAAIGLAQAERIGEILLKRKQIESWYNKRLPKHIEMPVREVLWMYDVNVGVVQTKIKNELYRRGVDSRYFFKPMSEQPMYEGKNVEELNAYYWSRRGLYLPTFTEMSEKEVDYVCTTLLDIENEVDRGII